MPRRNLAAIIDDSFFTRESVKDDLQDLAEYEAMGELTHDGYVVQKMLQIYLQTEENEKRN